MKTLKTLLLLLASGLALSATPIDSPHYNFVAPHHHEITYRPVDWAPWAPERDGPREVKCDLRWGHRIAEPADPPATTPEPLSAALVGLGLAGIGVVRRYRS